MVKRNFPLQNVLLWKVLISSPGDPSSPSMHQTGTASTSTVSSFLQPNLIAQRNPAPKGRSDSCCLWPIQSSVTQLTCQQRFCGDEGNSHVGVKWNTSGTFTLHHWSEWRVLLCISLSASNSGVAYFNGNSRLWKKGVCVRTLVGNQLRVSKAGKQRYSHLKNGPTEEQSNSTAFSLSQVLTSDKVKNTTQECWLPLLWWLLGYNARWTHLPCSVSWRASICSVSLWLQFFRW